MKKNNKNPKTALNACISEIAYSNIHKSFELEKSDDVDTQNIHRNKYTRMDD